MALKRLYGNDLFWDIPVQDRRLFLTFDDGPVPEVTPEVLEILDDHQAKATFFCVGDNVRKYPVVFNKIIDAGHRVGNHTFSHLNGWKTPLTQYLEDVNQCQLLVNAKLFRPPYGKIRRKQKQALSPDYHMILWSALSWDFDPHISPDQCLEFATTNIKPGSIIVFHDSLKASKNMLYALPRFLKHFSRLGFTFDTINEKDLVPGMCNTNQTRSQHE